MAKAKKDGLDPGSSPRRRVSRRLKVFKTPIGFHDAYVAAPSRKAALEAWGAGTDLFSAGISEEVKDLDGGPAQEALAKPGEIVRAKRTGADIIAMPTRPAAKGKAKKEPKPRAKAKPTPKPKPRPSRAGLERAEMALARLEEKQAAETAEFDKEEARLANRRRALESKQRQAKEKAEAKRDQAERAYRKAMKEWAG